jgi:hypothetical protein
VNTSTQDHPDQQQAQHGAHAVAVVLIGARVWAVSIDGHLGARHYFTREAAERAAAPWR